MIDADRTLSCLGVDVSTLTHGSSKKVFTICEECGRHRLIQFCAYRELCRSCAAKGNQIGAKNPMYGRTGAQNPRWIQPIPKETLKQLYLIEKETPKQIGGLYGVSDVTIRKWLKQYNIPIRSYKEAQKLNPTDGKNNPMYGRCGKDAPAYGRHGAAHYNWKGGITEWRERFHYSLAYKEWRKAVFERDHFTCQMCGDDSGGNLQAHHIKPVREHKNDLMIIDINNGITLCKDCHQQVTRHEPDFEAFFNAIIED